VRRGLAPLIDADPRLTVCGEAEDVPDALRLFSELSPNAVIADLSLKSGSGIDLIKQIRAIDANVPVLVLSMHDESFHAERALRAGARGYLTKQEASEQVITALHQILDGEIYVSERLSPKLMKRLLMGGIGEEADAVDCLSDRELQVFEMIARGLGTHEIAQSLNLSVKTIETYRAHIKEKLGLKDARELVRYAMRWAFAKER